MRVSRSCLTTCCFTEGSASSGGAAAIHHTLQRHTEILADYRGEFSKTSANIAAMMEREELLGSVSQVGEVCFF